MMLQKKVYKGKFSPKNYKKYIGDPTNIIYRSGWEKRFMRHLDENPNIIEWQSEGIAIPYKSPLDNKFHRYFPDFFVKIKAKDGSIKSMIIEIKPEVQTHPPKSQARKTRRYINEAMTWGVNEAKWKGAVEYCLDRGYEFKVFTEKHLGFQ